MRMRLAAARGEGSAPPVFVEETEALHPTGKTAPETTVTSVDKNGVQRPVVDVYGDFRRRFGTFVKVRNRLVGRRIRAHVFSGIEFQMFVFIVGPLTGWIIGVTTISAALLVAFELLLIVKLWTATRSYAAHLARAGVATEADAEVVAAAAQAGPADLIGAGPHAPAAR
jgi:hypothetical protein